MGRPLVCAARQPHNELSGAALCHRPPLAKLRPAALSFVLLIAQMIPGIIMAMRFSALYPKLGVLNT